MLASRNVGNSVTRQQLTRVTRWGVYVCLTDVDIACQTMVLCAVYLQGHDLLVHTQRMRTRSGWVPGVCLCQLLKGRLLTSGLGQAGHDLHMLQLLTSYPSAATSRQCDLRSVCVA